jgi:serine/threonine protein kinase
MQGQPSPDANEPSFALLDMQEPIPGYTLEERIGVGGYGEVWRANAPGGLKKAVKIVHGNMSDSRTEREMKAMERIRAVSHPMLLSVERVEIIHDHLFIVTELAEGSLKDRFDACSESDAGIPRDELLAYLRDAADALDFLYEKHHLQHLDVKPENLLMVGGRVKVADFGLVKDLADKGMSLVGGLTPMYAPPEVFDGAPTRHSDQYSLAIVYQEMLTGEAPFGGRTAAQLASQHVNCEPMISPLPHHDRGPITRALSKDPQRRFPSCRTLIQELLKAPETEAALRIRRSRPQTNVATERAAPRTTRPSSPSSPEIRGSRENATVRLSECKQFGSKMLPDSTDVMAEEPVEFESRVAVRPTLFIGVGGAAARALKKLKRRIADLAAPIEQLPSLAMLHLDVALDSSTQYHDDEIALTDDERIAMPLRDAREYRERSGLLLEWLNRRWLYNIPRSLRTEGMRPLGRLAFMDHFENINDALRRGLADIMAPGSISDTGKRLARQMQTDAPQIVLVSSISGGAGSGCVLDLGYAIRDVLNEMGLSDGHIQGLLLHSTPRKAAGREIAIANSVACLSELSHFDSVEGGYPGEPACGIQPRSARRSPFAHTYFTILGEELDDTTFDNACRDVAEYVFQSTLAPTADFFAKCRKMDGPFQEQSSGSMHLRSFGISQVGGGDSKLVQTISELVCRALVDSWLTGQASNSPSASFESKIDEQVQQLLIRIGADAVSLVSMAKATVQATVSNDVESYFRRIVRENSEVLDRDSSLTPVDRAQKLLHVVDELAIGSAQQDLSSPCLRSVVEGKFRNYIDEPRKAISYYLTDLVDRPGHRVVAAEIATHILEKHLQTLQEEITHATRLVEVDLEELQARIITAAEGPALDEKGKPIKPVIELDQESALTAYAVLRMLQVAHVVSSQFVAELLRGHQDDSTAIAKLGDGLRVLASHFDSGTKVFEADEDFSFDSERSSIVLNIQRHDVACKLDVDLQEQYFDRQSPLSSLFDSSQIEWSHLESAIRSGARRLVAGEISHVWTDQMFSESPQPASEVDAASKLEEKIGEATPNVLSLGGAKRLLVLAPQRAAETEAWSRQTAQAAGQPTAFVPAEDDCVTFCYETEHTSLRNVVAALMSERHDFGKLAERLHARIDIDWPPIM